MTPITRNLARAALVFAAFQACLPIAWSQEAVTEQTGPVAPRGGGGGAGGQRGGPLPADLGTLLTQPSNEMRLVVSRYDADRGQLNRFYEVSITQARIARMKRFEMDWQAALAKIDAGKLSPAARQELDTLKTTTQTNLRQLDGQAAANAQVAPLVPFAAGLIKLEESRRQMETMDGEKAAVALLRVTKQIAEFKATLEDPAKAGPLKITKELAGRAAEVTDNLLAQHNGWFAYYNDYDPLFTWWMVQPNRDVVAALRDYSAYMKNKAATAEVAVGDAAAPVNIEATAPPKVDEVPDLAELLAYPQNEMRGVVQRFLADRGGGRGGRGGGGGGGANTKQTMETWLTALKTINFDKLSRNAQVDYLNIRNLAEVEIRRIDKPPVAPPRLADPTDINGRPVGRDALMYMLQEEMIPYTPEQLLNVATKEAEYLQGEEKKVLAALKLKDWNEALELAKEMHAPVGHQTDMIRDQMREAVDYLRAKDLITVPEIDSETLRMEMMTPQRQLVNPFFTGGALISVSYPHTSQNTQSRLEAMRGNNIPFSRATVHHELIPGHNMQGYVNSRFRAFRGGDIRGTPFYGEGWAVYWEITLYDQGYPKTPENQIGFIFWRMHRCARIIFSLNFHLGNWNEQKCIDYLVDFVGHERENAIAEVRRSFNGSYAPLYQAGYLLGALQFRALHKELVTDTKQMTDKQFHDAILQQTSMPVSLVRMALSKEKLSADQKFDWMFYGPNP